MSVFDACGVCAARGSDALEANEGNALVAGCARVLRVTALLVSLFTTVPASAGWTGVGEVTTVWVHGPQLMVQTTIAAGQCGTPGKFFWDATHPHADALYSTFLTAMSTDKKVQVVVADTPSQAVCLFGADKVNYVRINRD